MKVGDEVKVTTRSGLWAKTSPTGTKVKVRPYGWTFDITRLENGWASGGKYWYSCEYLAVVKPTERIPFRGRLVCSCVATSLPLVEQAMIKAGVIKYNIDIYQAGYNRGGVSASAGTHDRGGCIDVGQYSTTALAIWRLWGWAMQARTRAQGFTPHGHGSPKGCPHLSAGAAYRLLNGRTRGMDFGTAGPSPDPNPSEGAP